MTVINGAKKFEHDVSSLTFIENLVLLSSNFVEELTSRAILHDKIHVLCVLVCLIILDYVRMIESRQYLDFIPDPHYLVLREFDLVEKLNCNLQAWISDIMT